MFADSEEDVMKEETKYPCFTGVPSFFRYLVADAASGRGGVEYSLPGFELARHSYDLLSTAYDLDDPEEVNRRYDELLKLIHVADEQRVLQWYERNFPACMELVPSRRRQKFVDGVFDSYAEGIMA